MHGGRPLEGGPGEGPASKPEPKAQRLGFKELGRLGSLYRAPLKGVYATYEGPVRLYRRYFGLWDSLWALVWALKALSELWASVLKVVYNGITMGLQGFRVRAQCQGLIGSTLAWGYLPTGPSKNVGASRNEGVRF